MENHHVEFKYLHKEDYPMNKLEGYSLEDLISMFKQKDNPELAELAYLTFISKSPWGIDFNFERRITRTNMQLRLPLYQGEGISWKFQKLNPTMIWATEDTLDHEKYELIKTAVDYALDTNKPTLPPIIWNVPYESRYKFVCHDGHHRIKVFSQLQRPISAVVLEYWIDNREDPLLPKKLHYREIDLLVKDLPIIIRDFNSH